MPCDDCEKTAPGSFTLTVGMAVYDDFDNAAMTIQSLRLHHLPYFGGRAKIVVVDNHPDSRQGQRLKTFCAAAGVEYHAFTDPVGSSLPKNHIFTMATTDVVCVIDSHILIDPGALRRLVEFAEANPANMDLWHGPLMHDALRPDQMMTHMEPRWGTDLMYGVWGDDPRSHRASADPRAEEREPFEIELHGMGLFACRRIAWCGMPAGLRGFGGDEGYVHKLFRRAGRKVLHLPFLRAWHLFRDHESPPPYPCNLQDRLRNYLTWSRHVGEDPLAIAARYAESGKIPVLEVNRIVREFDAESRADKPMPGFGKRLLTFSQALIRHASNGMKHVTESEHDARLQVCEACEWLSADGKSCLKCGCGLEAKTLWASESCPEKKWPGDNDDKSIDTQPAQAKAPAIAPAPVPLESAPVPPSIVCLHPRVVAITMGEPGQKETGVYCEECRALLASVALDPSETCQHGSLHCKIARSGETFALLVTCSECNTLVGKS